MPGINPAPPLDNSIETVPTNTPDRFSFKDATFEEVLEDLLSRFILNLPEDELAEVERVCFQIEQAHWYYEDFIREENPSFPSLPLKKFSEILFHSCPLLHRWSHDHESAFSDFMEYKTRVPVCGAIMLNEALTKCVLVKGWKASAGWSFPKGKVNENEDEAFCAVREVLEETGYNLCGKIQRQHRIDLFVKQQPVTLFVVPGISEDFVFRTQTRKEISKIDWFRLADLPGWKKKTISTNNHKFYLIAPVIHPLKNIVRELRKERRGATSGGNSLDTSLLNDKGLSTSGSEESPISAESSSHTNCIEADVSSSQSSSIDPHTPLCREDIGPFGFDPLLLKGNSYDTTNETVSTGSVESIPDMEPISPDNTNHWSRLMTRLSDSEKSSSTTDTPRAPTPTAIMSSPRLEKTLNKQEPVVISSMWNEGQPAVASTEHPGQEELVRRSRQLQLLDSVLAEETARRDKPLPGHAPVGTRLSPGHSASAGYFNRPASAHGSLVRMRPAIPPTTQLRLAAPDPLSSSPLTGISENEVVYQSQGLGSARRTMYGGDAGLVRPSTALCTPAVGSVSPQKTQFGPMVNAAHRNQLLAILREGSGMKAEAGVMKGNHATLLSILNNGVRR